ncbi:uncharacterized protein EURHEDRAFT_101252 [Aspergillus ruber CBS 135680]|uniref:Zf-PARP-domain-containing protein n=1 Tax=Aspergillus ruber (strain CBS 135680) TaxID=1388766 RepID=A0A017SDH1_ASPRC|nr:zf-PARP-domain-containing protein [Aspergillus ruber CBS 135680]EYE94285.1 zf-PARP-domain-containing protein [Aspergillus ruber CBS 135680]
MGSYRLEEASTGRAGCQNKECKDAKTKIAKGELRFGTWVDTERIQAFMWRHWGCVTPKLIGNLNEAIDEEGGDGEEKDYTIIDGYEDLSDELQEKIRGALKQGHVDDEDWKGDVEMNRPGKTGFRVRKKTGAAAKDDEEKEPQPPKTKKRGKAQDNEDEEEPEKPTKKTKKESARGTKKAAKEEPESENAEEELKEEEGKEKPARKTRGRAAKTASADRKKQADAAGEDEEEMDDAKEPAEEKPKRGGRKKKAT